MNLGRLDEVIGGNRALQLAFHGTQLLDVEDELGLAQGVGLVEDLPADRSARRQALLGQHHPGVFDPGGVDEDGRTAAFERIGNACSLEFIADRSGFFEVEAREQELFAGVAALKHDDAKAAAHEGDDNKGRGDAHAARARQLGDDALGFFCCWFGHARPEKTACAADCD